MGQTGRLLLSAFILFISLTTSADEGAFDFAKADVKVWVWPGASQVQVTDPKTKTTFLMFFEYNFNYQSLKDFAFDADGPRKSYFDKLTTYEMAEALVKRLEYGRNLHVMVEEPRRYIPAVEGEVIEEARVTHSSGNEIKSIWAWRLPSAQQRYWLNRGLKQKELDFELFRRDALKALKIESGKLLIARDEVAFCSRIFAK